MGERPSILSAPRVVIGVPCSGSQSPMWWSHIFPALMVEERAGHIVIDAVLTASSALPDHNKNHTLWSKKRDSLTDINRNTVLSGFLPGKADWIFWIDDDTVPPVGVVHALLQKQRDFICGLYFLPKPPHNPIAYMRQSDGAYTPLWDYPEGALKQVDSVGMGCTLIHRSVYEKIREAHVEFVRPNGSIAVVPKRCVRDTTAVVGKSQEQFVRYGVLHTYVQPKPPDDDRPFPYYSMEYGRTEDHHFCELAAEVGCKPWVDTTINCSHLKMQETTVEDYKRSLRGGFQP
jgi:hypothetical protein